MTQESALCGQCGESFAPEADFCEACGHSRTGLPALSLPDPVAGDSQLASTSPAESADSAGSSAIQTPPTACSHCGSAIAADGYCTECGRPAQDARDHWRETPSQWVAGVCDRGLRHRLNQDAMALAASNYSDGSLHRAALVVCDGVSSTPESEIASLAAARAARDAVQVAVASAPLPVKSVIETGTEAAIVATAAAARAVLGAVPDAPTRQNPPSCTFGLAIVEQTDSGRPVLVAAGVGDTRIYWLPDTGTPVQVTTDDSWAQEQISAGVDRGIAESSPGAHAITRWLGADSPDQKPRVVPTVLRESGWVLVCSDGLWNYASPASAVQRCVHDRCDELMNGHAETGLQTTASIPRSSDLAAALVAWANSEGGHDNITVAVARIV